MKLTQAAKTFETNADFTSQDFTIGDVSVVIEILRNKLYRHKVRTLVQEYISNARDAMREIESKERARITLPTVFAPTFKVRDFGPGISPDRMYNVFIKYASSTKRDSNKQTGGFGIGAKSAWSYTESFSIVTFIDGVQRTYIAHIGANNNGRLDYLGEVATDAPNGTEIQIPVSPKDVPEFRKSAFRAVYFWSPEEKPVFVNLNKDEQIDYIPGDMMGNLEVNNSLPEFIVSKYDSGIVIVIDGIPYVAGPSLIDKIDALTDLSNLVSGRLVMHIDNGVLEVSASREEIADSKHTTDRLTALSKAALNTVTDKLTLQFSKAKTPFEHLTIYMELKDLYRLENYRKSGDFVVTDNNGIVSVLFKGVKMERCEMPAPKYSLEKGDMNKRGRRSWQRGVMLKAEWFNNLYFTDGTETALISNYRIKAALASNPTIIVFTKRSEDAGQFAKLKTGLGLKDLKTVSYTKPDRKTRETQKIERTKQGFCIHRMDRYGHKANYVTLENNTEKWLYVEKGTEDIVQLRSLNDYLEKRGFKVCALSKDAMKRVKGDKNFKPLADYIAGYKPTSADISHLKWEAAKNLDIMGHLSKVPGIKDKFLLRMCEEYKTVKATCEIPEQILKQIGKLSEVEDFKKEDAELTKELSTRYKLLGNLYWHGGRTELTEIAFYINAK